MVSVADNSSGGAVAQTSAGDAHREGFSAGLGWWRAGNRSGHRQTLRTAGGPTAHNNHPAGGLPRCIPTVHRSHKDSPRLPETAVGPTFLSYR